MEQLHWYFPFTRQNMLLTNIASEVSDGTVSRDFGSVKMLLVAKLATNYRHLLLWGILKLTKYFTFQIFTQKL